MGSKLPRGCRATCISDLDGSTRCGCFGRSVSLKLQFVQRGCRLDTNVSLRPRGAGLSCGGKSCVASAAEAMFGFTPGLSFHCHFSGMDRLHVACHKHDDRPDVRGLLPVISGSGPLGVHINGPNLGPSFTRAVHLFCGACGTRGRHNVVARMGFATARGDVDGDAMCSRGANNAASAPRGVGKG